jgi:hypothetical protein
MRAYNFTFARNHDSQQDRPEASCWPRFARRDPSTRIRSALRCTIPRLHGSNTPHPTPPINSSVDPIGQTNGMPKMAKSPRLPEISSQSVFEHRQHAAIGRLYRLWVASRITGSASRSSVEIARLCWFTDCDFPSAYLSSTGTPSAMKSCSAKAAAARHVATRRTQLMHSNQTILNIVDRTFTKFSDFFFGVTRNRTIIVAR